MGEGGKSLYSKSPSRFWHSSFCKHHIETILFTNLLGKNSLGAYLLQKSRRRMFERWMVGGSVDLRHSTDNQRIGVWLSTENRMSSCSPQLEKCWIIDSLAFSHQACIQRSCLKESNCSICSDRHITEKTNQQTNDLLASAGVSVFIDCPSAIADFVRNAIYPSNFTKDTRLTQ